MLTKNMLQYRLNGPRIKPLLLSPDDLSEDINDALQSVEKQIQGAVGRPQVDVHDAIDALVSSLRKTGMGLAKIAKDLLKVEQTDFDSEAFRWDVYEQSEKWRGRTGSIAEFHETLADKFGENWQSNLHCDLESRLPVSDVKPVKTSVLDRYNLAQVQGLIIQSETLTFTLKNISVAELRAVLRAAKFFQLIVTIESYKKEVCKFSVTGPLAIFSQQQSYGLKVASFFPVLVHFAEWQLEAEIKIKGRSRKLKLDQKTALRSHYAPPAGYIPEELTQIGEQLKQRLPSHKMSESPDPVNLGEDQLVLPDITLQNENGKKVHVEFFHKWHQGQLAKRLDFLGKHSSFLFVLVAQGKAIKQLDKSLVEVNESLSNAKVVEFAKVPSAKKIADAVNKVTASC